MNSKLYQCAIIMFATTLATACVKNGDAGPATAGPSSEAKAESGKKPFPDLGPEFGMACVGDFKFDDVGGTHWKDGQDLRLIGPMPGTSNLLVQVLPSTPAHDTKMSIYSATNVSITTPPSIYYVTTQVKKSPAHTTYTDHPQLLVIEEFEENCPDRIRFYSEYDPDEDGDDHGGHAGAGRF